MTRWLRRIKCWFALHEIEYLDELNILAKGRCVRCGGLFCCNKQEGTLMRWRASWDYEFDQMRR